MSDFSISQVLVLVLLLPALLRPFSKKLKNVSAIPIFPFIALVTFSFVVLAYGTFILFIPIFFFIIICVITDFSRCIMLFNNLPNNYYSVYSVVLRSFLLIMLAVAFFSVFYFKPENDYKIVSNNFIDKPVIINYEEKNVLCGTLYTPENIKNRNAVIFVFSPFPKSDKMKNTFTSYFIDKGYRTIEFINDFNSENFYIFKLYCRLFNLNDLFFSFNRKPKINEDVLNSVVSNILKENDNTEIYVISEGEYNKDLYNYSVKNSKNFSGVFFISSENEADLFSNETVCFFNEIQGLRFSTQQAEFNYCVMVRSKEKLPACGEIRCDDILASVLLNSSRDIDRADRIKAASAFEKWILLKTEITALKN